MKSKVGRTGTADIHADEMALVDPEVEMHLRGKFGRDGEEIPDVQEEPELVERLAVRVPGASPLVSSPPP